VTSITFFSFSSIKQTINFAVMPVTDVTCEMNILIMSEAQLRTG
jgi:hypothetical protein